MPSLAPVESSIFAMKYSPPRQNSHREAALKVNPALTDYKK